MNLYGWKHNPRGTEAWLNAAENNHPLFGLAGHKLIEDDDQKDTVVLTDYLIHVEPDYVRGVQGIGDCVSWGFGIASSILMAIQRVKQRRKWQGRAATEAIYGGSRVEARGQKTGGWSDGSYGAAAAKWLQEWGVVTRQDYSQETGNPEHDLREYNAKKAKQWGNYGCGGQSDQGSLDGVARQHPVNTASLVTTFEEAGASIKNLYPVPVCSNTGFERKTRDKDGFLRPAGSWAHCMCFAGVRWGARPGLLCVNSHYPYVKGPKYPSTMPVAIAGCSWWVDADICNQMLGRWKDSFALSQFKGFKKQKLDDLGFTFG